MTSVFDEGLGDKSLGSAPSGGLDGRDLPAGSPHPFNLWPWVVRLVLPVLLYLAGQVLYWLWFDNIYAYNWANVVGGLWIAFTMAIIVLWTVCAWLATEES